MNTNFYTEQVVVPTQSFSQQGIFRSTPFEFETTTPMEQGVIISSSPIMLSGSIVLSPLNLPTIFPPVSIKGIDKEIETLESVPSIEEAA